MHNGKLHIKRGDQVKVLAGKDIGKTGRVLEALPKERKAIVEGINIVKRHQRPTRQQQTEGIIEKEAPLDASNLMLICPKCREATRTGKRELTDGTRVRYCKKCEEIVDE